MKAISSVVVIFLTISKVMSENPIGGTGCSHRWLFSNGWCWRFCSGSSGEWCYTGSSCYSVPDDCASKTECANVDCASAENCVRQCSAGSSKEQSWMPDGSTGCKKFWFSSYCWRYCRGSSGNWCYTAKTCSKTEENCGYETRCGNIDCSGAKGCVKECRECTALTGLSFVPKTELSDDYQCEEEQNDQLLKSIYRYGPANLEYQFFRRAFELIDLYCNTRLEFQFELEITRAPTGLLIWRNIPDLRVSYPDLDGYYQAMFHTRKFIIRALSGTGGPTIRMRMSILRELKALATDVINYRLYQMSANPYSTPQCTSVHNDVLAEWGDLVYFINLELQNYISHQYVSIVQIGLPFFQSRK